MKLKFIIPTLFCLIISVVHAQMDTIGVPINNKVYLIFPNKIKADLGVEGDYKRVEQDKTLILSTTKDGAAISTLYVTLGDKYYFALLKATKTPKRFIYDFNEEGLKDKLKVLNKAPEATETTGTSPAGISPIRLEQIKKVAKKVSKIEAEITTLGLSSPSLEIQLAVIRNDEDHTYLQIYVRNKTSIPYKIGFIGFRYIKSDGSPKDVDPDIYPDEKIIPEIPSNSSRKLIYAIPSYGLAPGGVLEVGLKEKDLKGERVLPISIKAAVIQNSPYIN